MHTGMPYDHFLAVRKQRLANVGTRAVEYGCGGLPGGLGYLRQWKQEVLADERKRSREQVVAIFAARSM